MYDNQSALKKPGFPLLGNLSLDREFQHLLGKMRGIEESRDFGERWHFWIVGIFVVTRFYLM